MKNTTLTKKIETLFEQSNIELQPQNKIQEKNIALDKLQLSYEPLENDKLMENISYMATTMATPFENWNIFFTRLIPFFEMGFLFCDNDLKNQFIFGKEINCKNKTVKIKLPKSDFFQILKTDAKSVLMKLNISNLFNTEKMNCFYIRVEENIGFVLLTAKAEPWLQLKMDSLQKALINHQL
jgi:hypothetical protein